MRDASRMRGGSVREPSAAVAYNSDILFAAVQVNAAVPPSLSTVRWSVTVDGGRLVGGGRVAGGRLVRGPTSGPSPWPAVVPTADGTPVALVPVVAPVGDSATAAALGPWAVCESLAEGRGRGTVGRITRCEESLVAAFGSATVDVS